MAYVNHQDHNPSSPSVAVSTCLTQSELDPLLRDGQKNQQGNSRQSSDRSTLLTVSQGETGNARGLSGAAFNATPIYDAQGVLVGLQTPSEAVSPTDDSIADRNEQFGYASMQPIFPYSMAAPNLSYPTFPNYSMHQALPYSAQPQPYMHYHTTTQDHDAHQKPVFLATENAVVADHGRSTIIRGLPKPAQSFDTCPAVCSLFAIFCCPITLWCSLPALVYSLCAYTDYRTADVEKYQRKSDVARHLVITACIIGLLLCITWAILAFFYYEVIITTIGDIIRVIRHRFYTTF